ncbi:MAG TPA: DNA cytosine methyltransferase [Mucilaginibacter sp.]|jgi:DNA (cytosine-5)-methyltransferase 1
MTGKDNSTNRLGNYAVVDLFCGVGGLSHGFFLEKFNVIAGIDNDATCEYAFVSNNGGSYICEDIFNSDPKKIKDLFPPGSTKILVGCAPCQPFSRYNSFVKEEDSDDRKWALLLEFGKIIEAVQPDIISMENVPQLAKYNKKGVYSKFIQILEKNNYFISDTQQIVYCPDYGVPQNRKRLVLLASKLGPISLIPPVYNPETYPTVKEAIGDLPPIIAGETHTADPLHRAQNLSELNFKRIQAAEQGGSWRDWPEDLHLECHKKLEGRTFGDVYGRMKWTEPSPTLTTHCIAISNGRFGHPDQDRGISLREAAILQSFPKDYKFINPKSPKVSSTNIQRHIGNAVPVKLGQAIAQSIKIHLDEYSK